MKTKLIGFLIGAALGWFYPLFGRTSANAGTDAGQETNQGSGSNADGDADLGDLF